MNTLSIAALVLVASTPSLAQPAAPPPSPVVAVVRVPSPWYAPRALVVGKMRETIPQYAQLPGLAFKAFSIERASKDFGGLYYWRDAAAAQAWFNPAWFERVKKERGVEARVAFYDAPLSIDNRPGDAAMQAPTAPAADRMAALSESPGATPTERAGADAVATLVLIRTPAGVSRERLNAEFQAALPTFRAIPGLWRKHFLIGDNGAVFGGLYLWRDEASAKAWFNDAWHERVRTTYRQSATIDWFDTPILLPTRDAANLPAASAMMTAGTP
jgi:heme-degrading monooxygenase HmoA